MADFVVFFDSDAVTPNKSTMAGLISTPRPRYQVLTQMQSGHGYGIYNNDPGGTNLNDATDFIFGTQSAKATTLGNGSQCALNVFGGASLDATAMDIILWYKVDDPEHLSTLSFVLGSNSMADRFQWQVQGPGLPGHNLSDDNWVCTILPWSSASISGSPDRSDLTDVIFAANDDDTDNGVTFHLQAWGFVPQPASYPNGVVTFCFDDCFASQATLAQPILTAAGFRASLFPIVDQIGESGKLSLEDLRTFQDLLGWSVHAHSTTLSSHALKWTEMSPSEVSADLLANKTWLEQNGFRGSDFVAYPQGAFNAEVIEAISPYVVAGRTILPFPHETVQPADTFRLRAYTNVGGDGGTPVSAFTTSTTGYFDKIKADNAWCIIVLHDIVTSSPGENEISTADLSALVTSLVDKDIAVATLDQVLLNGGIAGTSA